MERTIIVLLSLFCIVICEITQKMLYDRYFNLIKQCETGAFNLQLIEPFNMCQCIRDIFEYVNDKMY